jgi:hypothetical protein
MSSHDCMVCGTEEPCQCPQDPLLEDVQHALRKVKIELLALRRRDAEKDATIAQLRQALAAAEAESATVDLGAVDRLRDACREVHELLGEQKPGEPWTDAETEIQAFAEHGMAWLTGGPSAAKSEPEVQHGA